MDVPELSDFTNGILSDAFLYEMHKFPYMNFSTTAVLYQNRNVKIISIVLDKQTLPRNT